MKQDRGRPTNLIQRWLELLSLILRIIVWPLRRLSDVILPAGEFDGLSPAVTEKAAQHFLNHLKQLSSPTQHASISEAFSTLGFANLKHEATTSHSLIVVFLYSPLHRQADEMCKKLIQPTMLDFLKQDNIKALGSSVHTSQGSSLSYQLGASCYPILAMLQPVGGSSNGVKLVFKAEGPALLKIQPTQLLPLLTGTYQRHQLVALEQETRRVEREQDVELRRQQDAEYQEALRADQERDRQREEEREREERRVRAEKERERKNVQEEKERLGKAKALLRPAPASGGTRIRFVLPNGKKLDRRFENNENVGALKAYLILYFADAQPEIKNIALTTNFPKKTHNDDSKTLQESDLCPQSVLMVQDLDA